MFQKYTMIIVTGAAGFIGSCFVSKLNEDGFEDIVVVDDFSNEEKNKNLAGKKITLKVERDQFFDWLKQNNELVQFVVHLGARTDTTEFDTRIFDKLNLGFSKKIWEACIQFGLPLIYASSAATYGDGSLGYDDKHALVPKLQPLNPYGISKNEFDKWALKQEKMPYFWAGFKFFNVYGPNEYHKGRMASVVFHAYNQIKNEGHVRLFRSHRTEFADGEQKRDFVYVKDVCDVLFYFMTHRNKNTNGIYNLGTGNAESFNELANSVYAALGMRPDIRFIDTPEDIRDKYQYFTEANMNKLREAGYNRPFRKLAEGTSDYINQYLSKSSLY